MPKPGTRRPSYIPPPPPEQPEGEARRISLEPPPTLGREVKDFTKVPKYSYFTFLRDVNQFSVERDSMDSRFHTHVQADIFSTFIVPNGLSVHHYIELEHIRTHPAKYPGAIELIESSGLAAPFAFRCDFNIAVIHQFYATCFFGSNNTVSWMTSDVEFTTSYAEFVAALVSPTPAPKSIRMILTMHLSPLRHVAFSSNHFVNLMQMNR